MTGPATSGMDVGRLVRQVTASLNESGIDTAGLDARLIVMRVCGLTREDLLRDPGRAVGVDALAEIARMTDRRAKREPLARIFGEWRFRDFTFALDADTLVPRPETELLVETALQLVGERGACRIADLGTGSGCILLSLLAAMPEAQGVGTDISEAATIRAQANARLLNMTGRAQFAATSWLDGIIGPFDLIASNPPYIRTGDIADLEPEVRDHDPQRALDGGEDGYEAYRQLIPQAAAKLKPGGWLVLETGTGQHAEVADLLRAAGLTGIEGRNDMAGHERVSLARRELT
ncbi:peptide chain release factor N(5)-glutamine methyltransferase [Tepidamorphus sp. 3E244]|uniref:peptide chain release factor N(5)-glutamine methyltransferase n=1 Tax=Tepidamorphus sp. 3E244 TaxID=3385498 RepID=UPI0038FC2C0E